IHANALMAAQASEAAALQGKFAPMHQALFNSQKSWSNLSDPIDYFVILAGNIELDVERFKIDLVSNEVRQAVLDSEKIAKALQLSGTPTLFMNGRSIPNPRNYEELLKAVNNAKTN
ncbi:MAG: thioredoxin domain-containing protein, partial [Patescibacteria group bacterium]